MNTNPALRDGYLTLKEAARAFGTTFGAMRMYVWLYKVPVCRVGNVIVVNRKDLIGYTPRGKKLVSSTR